MSVPARPVAHHSRAAVRRASPHPLAVITSGERSAPERGEPPLDASQALEQHLLLLVDKRQRARRRQRRRDAMRRGREGGWRRDREAWRLSLRVRKGSVDPKGMVHPTWSHT
eukprot:6179393-Pleurochrysis_carterae.AAC.3